MLNHKTKKFTIKYLILILLGLMPVASFSQKVEFVKSFSVDNVTQAVAVDESFFYVINNREIIKFDKSMGKQVGIWKDDSGNIKHLNSGVIINDKLYCANSNFPETPMASSIEVFDPVNLQPIESHSIGIDIGSATWIDWHKGFWYVVFVHYNVDSTSGGGGEPGKSNQWSQLVKYSPDWNRVGGWIFPKDLILKFGTYSNSGGFITSNGDIYATGHDNKELYLLRLPEQGYTLDWITTLPAPFEGQGIAQDPTDSELFYGISRAKSQVIVGCLKK